jgi:NADH-ubiquinone oxidoreductase chain 4
MGTLILLIAFIVKLPLFSVHLWLPKAHVEAPVAGSIILAAVLLKLGGYGLIRVSIIFSKQIATIAPYMISVALIGAILSSIICLRQADLKSLIAYSSVGHIGILVAGVISLTNWGFMGALLIMIAHGIVSSGLFCLANITYEISHTRSIVLTKGLLIITPNLTLLWFLIIGANIAAPPSINLLREIILISRTLSKNLLTAIMLATLRFTTVAYSLYLYSAISHGGHLLLTNPIPLISLRYYILIIIHFSPIIIIITIPTYITIIQ